MSVDLYAICPCGNGKKVKFCKCKDSVGQMDRVLSMIEGGQVVPALDRLRTILDEHPDAAWALAIRGRMLLDLREYQSLEENAERFIRLQPSNPLALTQRAAAQVFNQDLQGATESLLEGLNESGREVDSFLLDVALIVAMGLAQSGTILSARVYALLALASEGYDQSAAQSFLNQIDSSPSVNHLLKSVPKLIDRPADVAWGERYDEAVSLLRSNKVLLAQDKFESLRRTASLEPAVLSGLFHCAVWRGDLSRQQDMASLLSDVETLDDESRWKYRAIAGLLSDAELIGVETQTLKFEVDDIEQAELALIASDRAEQLPADRVQQIQMPEGEVRPRSVFLLSDRPLQPESETEKMDPADAAVSISLLLLFGRQTDQAAQAIAYDVTIDRVAAVKEIVTNAIGEAKVIEEEPQPVPLPMALDERPVRQYTPKSMADLARFNREFALATEAIRACQLPLKAFNGKSLEETADDDSLLLDRSAIVRILEGQERLNAIPGVLDEIYQRSKIDPLPELTPTDETVGELTCADYLRVNSASLSPMTLFVLARNARTSGAIQASRKFAERLVEVGTQSTGDDKADPRIVLEGFTMLMVSTQDPTQAIEIGERGMVFAKENNLPFANILMAKLELSLSLADEDGFRGTLMEIEQNYSDEPAVMARVQQLLVQLGIIRPDGSLRQPAPGQQPVGGNTEFVAAAPPAESESKVWTPDQGSADSSGSGEGGGKLWVPGMD